MIVKIIGASLIILSCSSFGISLKIRYTARVNELENFVICIDYIYKEISYSLADIKSVITKTMEFATEVNKSVFNEILEGIDKNDGKPISDIWTYRIGKLKDGHEIYEKSDLDIIGSFGNLLGYGNLEIQEENSQNLITNLNERISDLKNKSNKISATSKIGVYAGIIIVVILL